MNIRVPTVTHLARVLAVIVALVAVGCFRESPGWHALNYSRTRESHHNDTASFSSLHLGPFEQPISIDELRSRIGPFNAQPLLGTGAQLLTCVGESRRNTTVYVGPDGDVLRVYVLGQRCAAN